MINHRMLDKSGDMEQLSFPDKFLFKILIITLPIPFKVRLSYNLGILKSSPAELDHFYRDR